MFFLPQEYPDLTCVSLFSSFSDGVVSKNCIMNSQPLNEILNNSMMFSRHYLLLPRPIAVKYKHLIIYPDTQ